MSDLQKNIEEEFYSRGLDKEVEALIHLIVEMMSQAEQIGRREAYAMGVKDGMARERRCWEEEILFGDGEDDE